MNKYFLVFYIFSIMTACRAPEPREPVVKRSDQFLKESVVRNRALQEKEEKEIRKIIDKDSSHNYYTSSNGFWYKYEKQIPSEKHTPEFGDLVSFTYDIYSIEGEQIYSEEEIGRREYIMDKEKLFTGMRQGLKLMKSGVKVTFYFPSSVAFGYYGDHEEIGRNMPIRATVTLDTIVPDSINKTNNHKNNN